MYLESCRAVLCSIRLDVMTAEHITEYVTKSPADIWIQGLAMSLSEAYLRSHGKSK